MSHKREHEHEEVRDAVEIILAAIARLAETDPAAAADIVTKLGATAAENGEDAGETYAAEDRDGDVEVAQVHHRGERKKRKGEREDESEGERKHEREHEHDEEREVEPPRDDTVLDLSVLISPDLPSTWPILPPLVVMRYLRHGPGPYASEALVIDEHTDTHFDAPNHFIPPQSTGLPNATPFGDVPSERLPIWQFVGEACVIDVQDLLEEAVPGSTPPITADRVKAWEEANRALGAGDVVFFYSGYADRFYRPLPGGRSYTADPLQGTAPAWSGIDPDCITYLVGRQIAWIGIDAPNIGPASPVAIATHVAGLSNGLIYTENLVNLGSLPATGSLVVVLGAKHAGGSGGESRVVAIADPETAAPLIRSARQRQVVDLSVLLREDLPVWWPGAGVGNSRMPYMGRTLHSWDQPGGPAFVRSHILDSHTGTHLVPPAYAVPRPGFDRSRYDAATRKSLERFEKRHGHLGHSTMTADRVPVSQLCGPARVIDVMHRVGTVAPQAGSPVIEPADIDRHEAHHGAIAAGEIVLFHSGHSDRLFQPLPQGSRCIADPLNGQGEGWPAPSAETIFYLAEKGVRCIGTDGPRMGGVDPEAALATYWAGGARGICFVEYLINTGALPAVGAYFLFAPIKVKGNHGGHGRALAIF